MNIFISVLEQRPKQHDRIYFIKNILEMIHPSVFLFKAGTISKLNNCRLFPFG